MKIFKNPFGAKAITFYERFQTDFREFNESYQSEKSLFHYLLSGNSVSIQVIKGVGRKDIQKDDIVLVFENDQIEVIGESKLYPNLFKIINTFIQQLLNEHYNHRLNNLRNKVLLYIAIIEKHNRKYNYNIRLRNELPDLCNNIELLLSNEKVNYLRELADKIGFEKGQQELLDDILIVLRVMTKEIDKRGLSISKL